MHRRNVIMPPSSTPLALSLLQGEAPGPRRRKGFSLFVLFLLKKNSSTGLLFTKTNCKKGKCRRPLNELYLFPSLSSWLRDDARPYEVRVGVSPPFLLLPLSPHPRPPQCAAAAHPSFLQCVREGGWPAKNREGIHGMCLKEDSQPGQQGLHIVIMLTPSNPYHIHVPL